MDGSINKSLHKNLLHLVGEIFMQVTGMLIVRVIS
jgi:hypothetical protein